MLQLLLLHFFDGNLIQRPKMTAAKPSCCLKKAAAVGALRSRQSARLTSEGRSLGIKGRRCVATFKLKENRFGYN
jgi:hypothetical protein